MNIVVVVQARCGSSRLPGKVLMPLANQPLLIRMLERVQAARTKFELIVATTEEPDDDQIAVLCKEHSIRVFRGHSIDLLDRHYRAALECNADVVVKIPSDCPLIDPGVIDRLLGFYLAHHVQYDFVSNLHPATYPDGNDVEIIPMAILERAWKEAAKPYEREHTTPFIWERPEAFRLGNVEWEAGLDYSMTHRWTIDYPEDYDFISTVYDRLWTASKPIFPLKDILDLLNQNPEISAINSRFAGVNWYRNHLSDLKTISPDQTRIIEHPRSSFMKLTELSSTELRSLEDMALRVREHIIRMSTDGGCFIGASLSCADLIVHLYNHVLDISPKRVHDPNRDYLLLSKGHDVPALYGTLAELGYIERERLANHLKTSDSIYWHPNRNIPGVEFHSGSLGHLLSVALGIALDIKMRGTNNKVYVIVGDGELNEGSVWEACLVAAAQKVDNLVAIVDRNAFQANIRTEDLVPLEPIEKKFEAFGWKAIRCDGHDFKQLNEGFRELSDAPTGPSVLIADTVRGKGLPSIEQRADRWFVNFTYDEVQMLLKELHGQRKAELTSDTLMVR